MSLDHMFSLKLHRMIACDNVLHLVEVEPSKETLGAQMCAKRVKMRPKLGFSSSYQVWLISFPLTWIR